MANLERIYTIPLGDAYLRVRNKRAKRAIAFVQAFALRHMKAEGVKISEGTNSLVFRDGMQKPPRRIKVRLVKGEDGIAKVWLIGEEEKLKAAQDKKKAEETRKKEEEKKAEEAKKKEEAKKAPAASTAKPAAAPSAQVPAPATKPVSQPAAQQPQKAAPAQAKPVPPASQKPASPSSAQTAKK
jgi:ribosomal protein L31E